MTPVPARSLIVDDEEAQVHALCEAPGLEGYVTAVDSTLHSLAIHHAVPTTRRHDGEPRV
jgi:hypothetical protein